MTSDNPQQFTIAPSDWSMPPDKMQEMVKAVVGANPGCRIIDVDLRNKIAIVEMSADRVAAVRDALGSSFLVDPNASLKY